jgi:hypothetical protein
MVGLDPPRDTAAEGRPEMNKVGAGRFADEARLVQAVLAIACPRCGAAVGRQCAGDQRVPVFCAARVLEGKKSSSEVDA